MLWNFKKVRQIMNERCLTLADVAALTKTPERPNGIHYSTIAKALERGTAHPKTVAAVSRALRISKKNLVHKDAA